MTGDLPLSVVIDSKGKPILPPERFKNAQQLREYNQTLIDSDRNGGRAALRARCDALFSGFATYPKGPLQKKGFNWFPRVNYRELEGKLSEIQSPLFDLIVEVDHCIELDLDVKGTNEEKDNWQRSIQKNFTWLLQNKWRTGYNYHFLLSQFQMLLHGVGAHVWPNRRWTPRTPKNGQLFFPEGTSLDFQAEGKSCMLRDFVAGEDAYGFIRNEDAAAKLGWRIDNVWKTLALAGKKNQSGRARNGRDIEELQRNFRSGDIGFSNSSQTGLWLNWNFVTEYEGGVSLYCTEETIDVGNKDDGYLYKKRFQFEEFPVTLYPFDIGFGDYHSVRGLGPRTKDFYELSNRIKNAMVAQVLISAFPQVKQTQPNVDPDKLKLMRMGALSILPYGVDFAQTQFPPLNNSGIALTNELRRTLENNNQAMQPGSPEPKDRETALSFSLRSQDAARVSNGMQSLYESNLQQTYDRMYRMVIKTPKGTKPHQKMAQEFRDRCRRDKVPDEALTEHAIGEIKEVTSTGSGSAAIRLHALMTLMQYIYPSTTEDKKIAIERDLVSTLMGGAKVDRYARSTTDANPPDVDESFAVSENNGLTQGGDAEIGMGQNDTKHADIHLKKAAEIIQAVQQGQMEPQQALVALQKLLDHAGQHLAKLQANPTKKNEFDQLAAQWKQIAAFTAKLKSQVDSEQGQAQQQQQQLSDDGQVKMAKVNQDGAIKEKKLQIDSALKFRKAAVTERLQMAQHTNRMRNMMNGQQKQLTR